LKVKKKKKIKQREKKKKKRENVFDTFTILKERKGKKKKIY